MSFSSLNSPPVIGALTVGCYGALSFLPGVFASPISTSWTAVQVGNALAYGLSVFSVSQPGRYDGQLGPDLDKDDTQGAKDMQRMSPKKQGRTLFPPAPWAFSIWGPIFIGEFVMVTSQLMGGVSDDDATLGPMIRNITGPFILAQCFQSLWAASFRPKYNQGYFKYISALNLSGIALSLSMCHSAFTSLLMDDKGGMISISMKDYCIHFLPLTLHFGWTTAASLANINGMFCLSKDVSARHIAWLGHASVVAATILGVSTTVLRKAPVYGAVIAWALAAVASGVGQRLKETTEPQRTAAYVDPTTKAALGLYGLELQRTLSVGGAVICSAASLFVSLVERPWKSML